jgi:hypothetical protein
MKKGNLVTSTQCAVFLFVIFFMSTADSLLTELNIDILNPVFGKTIYSASEKRITGFISLIGSFILWYMPEQPRD